MCLSIELVIVARASAEVERQRVELIHQRDLMQHSLYVADMKLAQHSWISGDVSEMRRLLENHTPNPTRRDGRGWEWYYLKSWINPMVTLSGQSNRVRSVAFSPDGKWIAAAGADSVILFGVLKIGDCRSESTHRERTLDGSRGGPLENDWRPLTKVKRSESGT